MYKITDYTLNKARQLGLTVIPSKKANKKIDVFRGDKYLASVGHSSYKDYGMYLQEGDKKQAEERKRLYHLRHKKKTLPERLAGSLLW